MSDFIASNGVVIRREGDNLLFPRARYVNTLAHDPAPRILADVTTALGEFFQAEADERLGRWRSTVDPGWTAKLDAGPQIIFFRHEDGVRAFDVDPDGAGMGLHRWTPELQAVASEYFAAHPEPKPWHEAAPGEIWAVRFGTGPTFKVEPMRVEATGGTRFSPVESEGHDRTFDVRDTCIEDAHRIWPEVSS